MLSFLILAGCLSGKRPPVSLYPELDKRLYQITPLPVTVGIYIAPDLRNHVQKEYLQHYNVGVHNFVFPIGESLSSKIEEMSKTVFSKVVLIDSIQDKTYLSREPLDGILAVSLKNSEIELYIEESVWRAIGHHKLSIMASFSDPKLNKIWESEIAVEGKGFDFISSRVQYEWWVTSGPNFAPAVNDAIEKVIYELAQKLTTSKEISDYIQNNKR
ncbi:MAG TPA: hypothetical protein ACFYEC_02975 [Candidatus Brocadiaceae bacterium]